MGYAEDSAGNDVLRNIAAILRAFLGSGEWLTDLYGAVGIASVSSVDAVNLRIDRLGERIEAAARQRTRNELQLLHLRVRELEAVIERAGRRDRSRAVAALIAKVDELDRVVRELPWVQGAS